MASETTGRLQGSQTYRAEAEFVYEGLLGFAVVNAYTHAMAERIARLLNDDHERAAPSEQGEASDD